MKIRPMVAELLHSDGRTEGETDRQTYRETNRQVDRERERERERRTGMTEANSRFSQFCDSA